MFKDYSDGLWHTWYGGDCPVSHDAFVEVQLRVPQGWNGEVHKASEISWDHDPDWDDSDLVAFRVVSSQADFYILKNDHAVYETEREAILGDITEHGYYKVKIVGEV